MGDAELPPPKAARAPEGSREREAGLSIVMNHASVERVRLLVPAILQAPAARPLCGRPAARRDHVDERLGLFVSFASFVMSALGFLRMTAT